MWLWLESPFPCSCICPSWSPVWQFQWRHCKLGARRKLEGHGGDPCQQCFGHRPCKPACKIVIMAWVLNALATMRRYFVFRRFFVKDSAWKWRKTDEKRNFASMWPVHKGVSIFVPSLVAKRRRVRHVKNSANVLYERPLPVCVMSSSWFVLEHSDAESREK